MRKATGPLYFQAPWPIMSADSSSAVCGSRASQIECCSDTSAAYVDQGLISIFRSTTELGDGTVNPVSTHRLVVASTVGNMVFSQSLPAQPSSIHMLVRNSPADPVLSNSAAKQTPAVFVAQVDAYGIWRLHSPKKGFKSILFTSEQGESAEPYLQGPLCHYGVLKLVLIWPGHRETFEVDSSAEGLPEAPYQTQEATLPHRIAL